MPATCGAVDMSSRRKCLVSSGTPASTGAFSEDDTTGVQGCPSGSGKVCSVHTGPTSTAPWPGSGAMRSAAATEPGLVELDIGCRARPSRPASMCRAGSPRPPWCAIASRRQGNRGRGRADRAIHWRADGCVTIGPAACPSRDVENRHPKSLPAAVPAPLCPSPGLAERGRCASRCPRSNAGTIRRGLRTGIRSRRCAAGRAPMPGGSGRCRRL